MKSYKFDPKKYLGKDRIQRGIQTGISKCWTWDTDILEYRCQSYEARKNVSIHGKLKETKAHFNSLQDAKQWIAGAQVKTVYTTIKFDQLIEQWKQNHVLHLRTTTQVYYLKRLSPLDYFKGLHVEQIDFNKVDDWISYLKANCTSKQRVSFRKELEILKQILNYYGEQNYGYVNPVNTKKFKKAKVKDTVYKNKDLFEADFLKFRDELSKRSYGELLALLATIHYYHALRVSEVAALSWEDITISSNPIDNKIKFNKSVKWPRSKGFKTYVDNNFKNSKFSIDGCKEYVIQPEVAQLLSEYHRKYGKQSGLIFTKENSPLEYRFIQHNYDSAFKAAGIKFSGTHVLRHGGTRNELKQHGDLTLSQLRLGNHSMSATQIYGVRNQKDLDNYTAERYKTYSENKE